MNEEPSENEIYGSVPYDARDIRDRRYIVMVRRLKAIEARLDKLEGKP